MVSFTNLWLLKQRKPLVILAEHFAEHSLMRLIRVSLGATLITVASASTGQPLPIDAVVTSASSSRPTPAAPSELIAEVEAKIAPLLANGIRLRSIDLGCQPPANAVLNQVAPGITRLNSRGFVVELRAGDRILACSATLDAERQMLVAAHEITQGEALSAADFELRWTDAFADSSEAISSLPMRGPFVAATAIRAGQPLLAIQLTRPLAIHPGDLVTVVVKNGPVTVRTQLEARSAAAVGDSASVINPETGMPVTVMVTGEKAAELVMQ
jgi:flagella basal body P-ring formation protein FlgA